MTQFTSRQESRRIVASRTPVTRKIPTNAQGKFLKVSQYFVENVFYLLENKNLKKETRDALQEVLWGKKKSH